jgi:hypothetical protein
VRPAVLGVAAAALLGGCSGGSGDGGAPSGPSAGGSVEARGGQAMVDAQLAFARCMREQGVDFPDPKPGGGGFQVDPGSGSAKRFEEAERACADEARAVAEAAPRPSPDELQADREATLRFARCMRERGVDVPDPKPSEGGTAVSVPPGAKDDPAFARAQAGCEGELRDASP